MPGVQTLVPIMLDHVNAGRLTLERFVDLAVHRPGARSSASPPRGASRSATTPISPIVDLAAQAHDRQRLDRESRCGWTPYDGMTVDGLAARHDHPRPHRHARRRAASARLRASQSGSPNACRGFQGAGARAGRTARSSPGSSASTTASLPEGDVTVAVSHSDLNYKDGLILKGMGGLVRSYPHVPGIDFAGTVVESRSPDFKPGDAVILTGWRVGETHWGGYAERARVRGDWLVKMPQGLDAFHAMALGTAGLTAMLAVMAIEEAGVDARRRGRFWSRARRARLGGVAIALLARLGYTVVAATGRAASADRLRALGRHRSIDRAELAAPSRPLLSARWAGMRRCGRRRGLAGGAGGDALRRGGRGLRQCRRQRAFHHRAAFHPARGPAGRDRFGDVSQTAPRSRLAAFGAGDAPRCCSIP